MAVIIINNSYSQIIDLTPNQFKALRKVLSYSTDPKAAYYAGPLYPSIKYMIDKKGHFPSGLLHRVKAFMTKHKLPYAVQDKRVKPPISSATLFKAKSDITPRPYQIRAVDEALKHDRGGLEMVTGAGKSITMALLIERMQMRTLVIVPNLGLKEQLSDTFRALFGSLKNITVENIDSPRLKTATDYDLLIIDECHHSASRTYQKLNKAAWTGIYHRYFFTGTFFRNQENETLPFEAVAGQLVYRFGYHAAVAVKAIVPVEGYYLQSPTVDTDATTWSQVYKALIINNDARNTLISDLLISLNAGGASTLCLVKEIAHGDILSALTGIPFVNGQDDTARDYIRQFNAGEINALIGTTGVIGEGQDTKACEYVVIAGLGKAKSAFQQQVGRAVRTYPGKESAKVILIKDQSHRFCLRHFAAQVKILKDEYNVQTAKLEL